MTLPPKLAVAMDWGGSWTRAAVLAYDGEILWQSRVANDESGDREPLLEAADGMLRQAIDWCAGREIAGVGVGVAGPVDAETGTLHQPPNLPALDGVSLKARWAPILGCPIWVGNDANLAALGEFRYGAGRDAARQGTGPRTLAYMTISTGIGGGVVDRGRMFLGSRGLAAEVGHMRIDGTASGPVCHCGNRGCLESLASGTAIARIARERLAAEGPSNSVLESDTPGAIDSPMVFEAAAQGDALAQSILEEVVYWLAVGLTNVLHVYNPDLVVLGGGVTVGLTELGLLPRIRSLMLERAMSERHKDFGLVASQLGDAAGLAGAAAMVWEEVGVD